LRASRCLHRSELEALPAKEPHEEVDDGAEEAEQADERKLVAGPLDACALRRPKASEGREQEPDRELDRVLRDA
jgi:hypothetical protein